MAPSVFPPSSPSSSYGRQKCKFDLTHSGAVVDNTVLPVVWIDNAPVSMLSTIHQIAGEECLVSLVFISYLGPPVQMPPVPKSLQRPTLCRIFKILTIIDDYKHNDNMKGIDSSDHYRSYYNTNCLFLDLDANLFWILDTTIVNA